jgi:anti-anti-sigma regulatory factor
MLKILKATRNDECVILTLIGRIEGEDLAELKRVVLEARDHNLVLDLRDVTLVDKSAIRFLARCESERAMLANCPPYIRDWIAAEKH